MYFPCDFLSIISLEIIDYYILASILLTVAFATLMANILLGFFRIHHTEYEYITELTVLVPFKNESKYIRSFLDHLRTVIPPNGSVKLLFINDHSHDLTPALVKEIEKDAYSRMINLADNLHGKKSAIKFGIQQSKTQWILQLDIDTSPGNELLIPADKLIPTGAKMVLVPLHPQKKRGIISAFFALDFLSLHFTGLGMARLGVPVLANAAAMFLNREAYLKACEIRTDWNEPSGDDIFAMMAIKKLFGSKAIKVVPDLYPLASVLFPKDFEALWNQRLRWISKVGQVHNFWFQAVSWIVLLVQILILSGYIFIALNGLNYIISVWMAIIFVSEIILLAFASIFARRTELLVYLIPAVLIYPFYLLALIISSAFKRPSWK